MKRVTIIFDCGCSLTLWAQTDQLKEDWHTCKAHHSQAADLLPLEGKTINIVSVEPGGH